MRGAGRLTRAVVGWQYVCYGFIFGPRDRAFVYFSDVSAVPPEAMRQLRGVVIDTLVVDALYPEARPVRGLRGCPPRGAYYGSWAQGMAHSTHFAVDDALAFVRLVRPRKTYLVGMTHLVRPRWAGRGGGP